MEILCLKTAIEHKRQEMHDCAQEFGLDSYQVLVFSKELDDLIIKYQEKYELASAN